MQWNHRPAGGNIDGEEAEEDVGREEGEEEERVRTYSRTADNYWLCQTTSVMSAFQPSASRRTS